MKLRFFFCFFFLHEAEVDLVLIQPQLPLLMDIMLKNTSWHKTNIINSKGYINTKSIPTLFSPVTVKWPIEIKL